MFAGMQVKVGEQSNNSLFASGTTWHESALTPAEQIELEQERCEIFAYKAKINRKQLRLTT